jgi:CRISPR-associated protein Csx10
MFVKIKVVLKAKSPLVLGSGPTRQFVWESRSFIAGSVLRGTLAQEILRGLGVQKQLDFQRLQEKEKSINDPRFSTVFLSRPPARFGWLYPVYIEPENVFDVEVFPAPCTAFACKPYAEKHGVWDLLQLRLHQALALRQERIEVSCPQCPKEKKERIERWRGYVIRKPKGEYEALKDVDRRLVVRVGLNRGTETAEEQILYTLEAILPHKNSGGKIKSLFFVGFCTMTQEQYESLRSLLDEFFLSEDGGYRLRIGTARARGLGEAVLILREMSTSNNLPSRLNEFQPKDEEAKPLDSKHIYFSLTARSPVLVLNHVGLPTPDLSSEILKSYAAIPTDLELLPEVSSVEQELVTGWSQAWGLPKPLSSAIAAGSVFTYRAPAEERKAVLQFLEFVETHGLGERLAEGFGELIACEPFHVDKGRWFADGDPRGSSCSAG